MTHSFPTRRSADRELVELGPVEGGALGGALDLDEVAGAGDDDVHVRLGADVLHVGQVEHGPAVDDAHRDRGDGVGEHRGRSEEHTSELQSLMRISYAVFCLKNNKPQSKRTE